ncbi:hypothetical protein [Paenibacillus sp. GCM10012303]|uniref:hypothetical protein n=1 Tax=Paenibacillus sp. GCM10012303 TaxID=3317340 RepID=UPI0036138553
MLDPDQTYFVEYTTTVTLPGGAEAVTALQVDDVTVESSFSSVTNGGALALNLVLSGSSIINTGGTPATLTLANISGTDFNFAFTTVTVVKLI